MQIPRVLARPRNVGLKEVIESPAGAGNGNALRSGPYRSALRCVMCFLCGFGCHGTRVDRPVDLPVSVVSKARLFSAKTDGVSASGGLCEPSTRCGGTPMRGASRCGGHSEEQLHSLNSRKCVALGPLNDQIPLQCRWF